MGLLNELSRRRANSAALHATRAFRHFAQCTQLILIEEVRSSRRTNAIYARARQAQAYRFVHSAGRARRVPGGPIALLATLWTPCDDPTGLPTTAAFQPDRQCGINTAMPSEMCSAS
jgi:hypothetical protein